MRISDWSSDVCSSDLGSRSAAGPRLVHVGTVIQPVLHLEQCIDCGCGTGGAADRMGPRAAAGRVALSAGVRRLGGVGVTPVTRKRGIAVAGLLDFVALLGWTHQRAGGLRIDVYLATLISRERES